MVTIEEFDKKGRKVKKKVEYKDDEDDENDDNDVIDLEYMERMLDEVEEEEDEEVYMDDSEDIYSDDYDEDDPIEEEDVEVDTDDDDEEEEDDNDSNEEENVDGYDEDDDENRMNYNSNGKERNLEATYTKDGKELWTLDLRNLLAINSHQMDYVELLGTNKTNRGRKDEHENSNTTNDDEKVTIKTQHIGVNDDYLLEKASEGCVQLLAGLWSLDTQKSDAGPMVILPSYFEIPTPRSLVSANFVYFFNGISFFFHVSLLFPGIFTYHS